MQAGGRGYFRSGTVIVTSFPDTGSRIVTVIAVSSDVFETAVRASIAAIT